MELALGLLAMGLLLNVFHKCDAVLEVVPLDTEVMVNDSTYLNCSTSLKAEKVHWRHGNNYIYAGSRILEPYNVRFSVEINSSTGTNNLVIGFVQPSDAGHYECLEDEGFGERSSAQLIVLDGVPVCKSNISSSGVIGPNTCGIEPDEIKLSCTITYHGNIFPILQWKASADDQSFIEGGLFNLTTSKNEVTYTLTMNSTLDLNNSSFICQTTRTSNRNYSFSSDVIKILYIFSSRVTINMTLNDELNCFVNTSQSCSYTWKRFNGYDWIDLSNDQILKPKEVGRHRCEATCSMRNKSCTLEPVYAEVYSIPDTNGKNLLALLALFAVAVGLIGLFVALYLRKKKRRNEERRQKEERQLIEGGTGQNEVRRQTEDRQLMERVTESGREEREQEQQRLIDTDALTKYRKEPELVKKINVGCDVWGLALLNDELFVASLGPTDIYVYDPVTFKRLRTIQLEGFACPKDIASFPQEKCLFIVVNAYGSSLFCIDRKGKTLKIRRVPNEPRSLSVTPCGNILLTCNAEILIYNPRGNLIQSISLDACALDMSWHTIMLKCGNIIVCQGRKGSKYHRVLKLNPQGDILKSFGNEKKHSDCRLYNPVYMAIDRDELICVADNGNNRVVLLNRELVFVKELIGKNSGITLPNRVILDEASGLLYVGTNNGQLLIFKVFNESSVGFSFL